MIICLEFLPISRGAGVNEKNNKVQVMGIVPDDCKKVENGLFVNNSAFPAQSLSFGISPNLVQFVKGGQPLFMKMDMINTKTGSFFVPIAMQINGKWEVVEKDD